MILDAYQHVDNLEHNTSITLFITPIHHNINELRSSNMSHRMYYVNMEKSGGVRSILSGYSTCLGGGGRAHSGVPSARPYYSFSTHRVMI